MVNQNLAGFSKAAETALKYAEIVFEGMQYSNPGYGSDDNPLTAEIAWLIGTANQEKTWYDGDIFSTVFFPIYDSFLENRTTVGVMRIIIHWARYFQNVLPESTKGIDFVLANECDEPFTYRIIGKDVIPIGHGDLHDRSYNRFERSATFKNIESVRFFVCRFSDR